MEETEIYEYQAVHNPSQPLDSLKGAQLNQVLVKICQEIKIKAAVAELPGRDTQENLGLESYVPQTLQNSRSESSALQVWRQKVAFLEQEAIASNAAQKFELKKQIQECEEAIDGLK